MDEDEMRPRSAPELPRPLEGLSISELVSYGEVLEREIARVRQELARRQAIRGIAETLFRPSPPDQR